MADAEPSLVFMCHCEPIVTVLSNCKLPQLCFVLLLLLVHMRTSLLSNQIEIYSDTIEIPQQFYNKSASKVIFFFLYIYD